MFKKTLEEIVTRAEGSLGALIMGVDGIAVEQVLTPAGQDANLDVAAAEVTSMIRSTQSIGRNTGLGESREIMVSFADASIILRLLSNEYFLLLALKPESNIGRGRYELRRAELTLAKEFQI